jgi:DNA-binding transcriptional ArsR family regulator
MSNSELKARHTRVVPATQRFAIAAHPLRLRILLELMQEKEPVRIADLAPRLGISSPTLAAHLLLLRAGGLVERRREGNNVYYTIKSDEYTKAIRRLIGLVEQGRWPSPFKVLFLGIS